MSRRSLSWLPAVLLVAWGAIPARLHAQDVPVVFQHGVVSDSGTWDLMKAPLTQQLRMTAVTKSLQWYQSEEFQANQLIGLLNADPRTSSGARVPFVAHSNGGLVSRRVNYSQARISNLATIASPHLGAHLANSFLAGQALGYFGGLRAALWDPIDFYSHNDPSWPSWLYTAIDKWNGFWAWLTSNASYWLCDVFGMCTSTDFATYFAPVVLDVAEGSGTLQTLNSQANLDRERATISNRVYLYSSIHPRNGFIHLLFPGSRSTWEDARSVTTSAYFALGTYYSNHSDYFLSSHSYMWTDGGIELQMLDANWQNLLGTIDWGDSYWSCPPPDEHCEFVFAVWANDGLIDHRSAGVSTEFAQRIDYDVAHTEQLKSPDVANVMKQVLNVRFGVPIRTASLPDLTIAMTGPTRVKSLATCGWWAVPQDGTPPYSYQWYVNGGVAYPSDPTELVYRNQGSSFSVRVDVTDANGRTGSVSKFVMISSLAPACPW